jgi:hypothetical protein
MVRVFFAAVKLTAFSSWNLSTHVNSWVGKGRWSTNFGFALVYPPQKEKKKVARKMGKTCSIRARFRTNLIQLDEIEPRLPGISTI